MRTRSFRKGLAIKHPAATKGSKRTLCAEPIKGWPARERPRERLLAEGPARLSDAELLAVILRVGSGSFTGGGPGSTRLARKGAARRWNTRTGSRREATA